MLAVRPQRFPARQQEVDPIGRDSDGLDQSSHCFGQVLAVVEHDQLVAHGEHLDDPSRECVADQRVEPELGGERAGDVRRIAHGAELDPDDSVVVPVGDGVGDVSCQPALADATRPAHGDDPAGVEKRNDARRVVVASDERAQRQRGRRSSADRRGRVATVHVPPLHGVQLPGLGEALERNQATGLEGDVRHGARQILDHPGDEDLTRLGTGHDAGGGDDGLPGDVVVGPDDLAGVDADAHAHRPLGVLLGVLGGRALDADRTRQCGAHGCEGEQKAIPERLDLPAPVARRELAHNGRVGIHDAARDVISARGVQLRRPFHVGEDDGERSHDWTASPLRSTHANILSPHLEGTGRSPDLSEQQRRRGTIHATHRVRPNGPPFERSISRLTIPPAPPNVRNSGIASDTERGVPHPGLINVSVRSGADYDLRESGVPIETVWFCRPVECRSDARCCGRAAAPNVRRWSAGCAGDEVGDDVGGVPVKGLAAAVVSHRRAWVGVTGCFLDVAERDAGVEGGGDEGVSQGVRSDSLADAGAAGDASHDPPGGVAVQSPPVGVDEDRSLEAFTDRQVDRSSDTWRRRHGDQLAALFAGP